MPGQGVGLGADSQGGLDGDVHDHDTLGTEMEGEDLQGIGNKETGETDVVEDTENPDEDDLADTVAGLSAGIVVHGGHDGPEGESNNHTYINRLTSVPCLSYTRAALTSDGSQEEGATSHAVDHEGGTDGAGQIQDSLAGRDLQSKSEV